MHAPLIVGGGPAGSAAALRLAAAGLRPTLLERSVGPEDKVCGDFLSGGSLARLHGLGVDPAALGGHPIDRVRLFCGSRRAEAPLPFPACGLSRRQLDSALLGAAERAGAVIRRGVRVRGVATEAGTPMVRLAGETLAPPTLFLATGKHDVAGALRPDRAKGAIGLKLYLRLSPAQRAALAGAVELVLLPGGYAGLQLVEGDRAVLCVVRRRGAARLGMDAPETGGPGPDHDEPSRGRAEGWAATEPTGTGGVLSADALLGALAAADPHLAQRLHGTCPETARPLAIAGVPYGHLHRPAPTGAAGVFRLGDQGCVIPSLTGEGIALALGSGRLAAEAWLAGEDGAAYHRRLAGAVAGPLRRAGGLHRLCLGPAQAWAVAVTSLLPGLLPLAARWTRAPRLG
ncbi:MAG: hypothetical protein BGO51_15905 [Rhodospirillales bacterium 69-11]|nr:FAD-dependent monooxygenase [Rhodospirillales bacterium]OJW23349.1 MAG: hypothetical protein BGO51_15905 [Rhodospirillales bacterium 69-11]